MTDSTHYLVELIKTLEDDRNASIHTGEFKVTAVVNNKEIVSGETIQCALLEKNNGVDIDIHWEDYGYKAFRELGLYGRSNSKYFMLEEISERSFRITDKNTSNTVTLEW